VTTVKSVKSRSPKASAAFDWTVPTTPANSFITDISTWFARDHDSWLSTAAWVSLLGVLNIPAPSARTALHRMTNAAYLERDARNGRSGYALSKEFSRWIDTFGRVTDDDSAAANSAHDWVLVTFSIPEVRRADRHAMRTILGRLGFAPLGNGVWIGSAARLAETQDAIAAAGFGSYAEIFLAAHQGFSNTGAFTQRCWDLDGLAVRYRGFVHDVLRRLKRKPRVDPQTFADVIVTTNSWRRINFDDPRLPATALPRDWPRQEAKAAHNKLLTRFLGPARDYVEALHR